MNTSLRGLAYGCAVVVVCTLASPVSATDIPFYVTNNSSEALCLVVSGPWARENGLPNLAAPFPGTNAWHFYTAETGIFSPFGQWQFVYYKGVMDGNDCAPRGDNDGFVHDPIQFCLQQRPSLEVDLTINPDFSASVNAVPPPCPDSLTATADLGHAGRQRGPAAHGAAADRDSFSFEGEAGEAVTINLAGEGAAGHAGEVAGLQLLLRGSVVAASDGPLPLVLDAILPEPGEYHVVVLERPGGASERFRGRYVLTVVPDAGSDGRLLHPEADTEHF